MTAYNQWLRGVRRRAAVRSRCWRWLEDAVAGASGKRVWGIAAALATAAVLGVGIGVAAQHASRCQSSARPTALAQRSPIAAQAALPNVVPAQTRPAALRCRTVRHG
jgi:hypothetical protein